MEKYTVTYGDEFFVNVEASTEAEAIEQAQGTSMWECMGELHSDMLVAELID